MSKSRSRKKRQDKRRLKSYRKRVLKKTSIEQLEARQLLDAGGFSEFAQSNLHDVDATSAYSAQFDTRHLRVDEATVQKQVQQQASNAVIFVDAGVEDHEAMLSEFDSDAEVIFLSADKDGIEQISAALAERSGLSSVHIVAHGDEGEVRLGNSVVRTENLEQYSSQLAAWSDTLTDDADILFYGCDLAGNHDGEQFIESFSELTGADVAASDDLTGHASLGGDWDLEKSVGVIETQSLVAASWVGTLMDTDGDGIDDEFDVDDDDDGILDTEEGCATHLITEAADSRIIFLMDTSGSVSAAEFADWAASLNDTATEILSRNPDADIAVMQFGGDNADMQSIITHPLTNAHPNFLASDRINVGSSDHIPDALAEAEPFFMAGGALDLTTGTNNTIIIFTDGVNSSSSNLSNPPAPSTYNSTDAPDGFGIYPILESTYDIRFIVAHAGGNAAGEAASMTISSEDAFGNDLTQTGTFDLTELQIGEIASAALYEDFSRLDTDGDGLANCVDVDSDDDGILDTIEARSVYLAPLGVDLNNDGLDLSLIHI